MEEKRSGNLTVENLVKEIQNEIVRLNEIRTVNPRAKRQWVDAMNFLELLASKPYKKCKTVSELKKKISEERNKFKKELDNLAVGLPGHQFSFFENPEELSDREEQAIKIRANELEAQIKWLHKCLGICSNKNYFK